MRAFTLIELMITVAIVAILAATAVVGFERYKIQAVNSEVAPMLYTIAESQIAFYHKPRLAPNGLTELDACFLQLGSQPSRHEYVFVESYSFPVPFSYGGISGGWDTIGVPTTGNVNFIYTVVPSTGPALPVKICSSAQSLTPSTTQVPLIHAAGDYDGDRIMSTNFVVIESDGGNGTRISQIYTADEFE